MKRILGFVFLIIIFSVSLLSRDEVKEETVRFEKGRSSALLKGSIQGYAVANYYLNARKGQEMKVTLDTRHGATYFNVLTKGSPSAFFIGSIKGKSYTGKLPEDGDYTIQVYMMRSAARRRMSASTRWSRRSSTRPARTD